MDRVRGGHGLGEGLPQSTTSPHVPFSVFRGCPVPP